MAPARRRRRITRLLFPFLVAVALAVGLRPPVTSSELLAGADGATLQREPQQSPEALGTSELDELPGHRPLRMVITSCYSGGFAELAFDGASEDRGAATTDRCGFFATTWDRAASGCDPNPDRGAQAAWVR